MHACLTPWRAQVTPWVVWICVREAMSLGLKKIKAPFKHSCFCIISPALWVLSRSLVAPLSLYVTCIQDCFLLVSSWCTSVSKNICAIINHPQSCSGVCARVMCSRVEWGHTPSELVTIHCLTSTRLLWKNSVVAHRGIGRMLFSRDTGLPSSSTYFSKKKYHFA